MADTIDSQPELAVPQAAFADLVTDIWRIGKRIARDPTAPTPVLLAWERAMERLTDMGVSIEEQVGEAYHESMRVRVAQHEGGDANLRICECLTPAIYYQANGNPNAELVRPAEVVVRGE